MDGYLQSTIAANSFQQSRNNVPPPKVIVHFPPTNKEFSCNEIRTPEGSYSLLHETFFETIAPQFATGTRASVTSSKFKRDDSSGDDDELVFMPTNKSAALPIPNSRNGGLTASSSTSSMHGLSIVTSFSHKLNSQPSPYLPMSPSYHQSIPPTQSTPSHMLGTSQELASNDNSDYFASASYNNGGSSVGSFSSLFAGGRSMGKTPSSVRNNSIVGSKPKNHLAKTKSSFVLRFLIHDNLQKVLAAKTKEDQFVFFNIGSSFIWVDGQNKPKEPLSRIVFYKSYPLCHDINEATRSDDHLDIIIGFSTGDIIWYDPLGCKYVRLNKGGCLVNSAVSMIKWLPASEDLFLVAFKDGSVMIMDKERDDLSFSPPEPGSWLEHQFYACHPHKSSKYNPVAHWKVSKKGLTDISFSSDNVHVALTGSDGLLRIIDYKSEKLRDVFQSYFGRLTCVDWSPDGHYILTGGEDDLVTLWSFVDKKLVARCQGHKSWVTSVKFDPWLCDGHTYRFGSVGEDCNLILWDFSFSALQKPKHGRISTVVQSPTQKHTEIASPQQPQYPPPIPLNVERKKSLKSHRLFRGFSIDSGTSSQSNGSGNSNINNGRFRKRASKSGQAVFMNDDFAVHEEILPTIHPLIKKNLTAVLQPTIVRIIHADPCVGLEFREQMLVTTDRRGRTRTWGRP